MASLVVAGDVSGSVTLSAPSAAGSTVITLPTTSGTMVVTGGAQTVQFAAGSAASPSITFTGDTNTGIFSPAADTIAFSEGGVESMRIDASGNVGIGKSPGTSILDIAGEGQTGSNNMYLTWSTTSSGYGATFNLRKSNGTKASPTAVANGDQVGVLVFAGYDGSNYQNAAYIESRVDGTPGTNDMPGRLVFFTTPDGSASSSERMRITSSGDLLVGASSNSSGGKLLVNGITYQLQTANGNNATPVLSGGYLIGPDNSNVYAGIRALNSYLQSNASQLAFYVTNTSGSAYEAARFTAAGNMVFTSRSGGGNTQQLVVGTTTSSGSINSYGAFIADSSSPYPLGIKGLSNAQGMIGFFNSSDTVIGEISKNIASVNYSTSSDYRLKENIAPMTGALAKVQQLKPCTYTWKIDGSTGQGFIAHELQSIVPDCVTGEKDGVETYIDEEGNEQTRPKYQGVDTSFLVATLTAAIQELNAKVEAQAAEIAALKGAN